MYATDHAVLRYKFRLWDSSNGPYAKSGRFTGELKKAQRTLYYHHCCQRLGSSGCCTDEEIDIDSHVIGDWSVCPQSVVKIKYQLPPEIESSPIKRQPAL